MYSKTLISGLICLWDSGSSDSTIKQKRINPYKSKLRANKAEDRTASDTYKPMHGVKFTFSTPEFSSTVIITHNFHVVNE